MRIKRTALSLTIATLVGCASATAADLSFAADAEKGAKGTFQSDPVRRIDPALLEAAKQHKEVPVIIILREQPQHRVAEDIQARYRDDIEASSREVRRLLEAYEGDEAIASKDAELERGRELQRALPFDLRDEVRALNVEREEMTSQMRKEMKAAVDRAVAGPQIKAISAVRELGGRVKRRIAVVNAIAADVPVGMLTTLAENPEIAEIVYDAPGKPELDNQRASLGVNSFWAGGYDGGIWDVGVLDNGVDENHPAISSHDFFENTGANGDHGTGVACMYGSTNSTLRGLAYGLDAIVVENAGSVSTSMAGADWMIRSAGDDAETINYSWGNGAASTSWSTMARFVDAVVHDHNVAWVKSAGNNGPGNETMTRPGENYNAITVANMNDRNTVTRSDDVITSSSSRGPTDDGRKKPDISAPGNMTRTCEAGGGYRNMGGTSSAAPKVGAGTLLLRDAGHTDPMTMKAVLINTADSWDDGGTQGTGDDGPVTGREWNRTYGWGYLDLGHAYYHRNDYFRDYVRPRGQSGDYRLYKGYAYTGDKATLVWEREVDYRNAATPTNFRDLSDIDLRMYRESNNTSESSDISIRDNVHQVAATGSGAKVVKVYAYSSSFDGASREYYALATEENFSEAVGPRFSVATSAPTSVFSFRTFTVSTTVRNTGDLDGHNLQARINLPIGFSLVSGAQTRNLASIANGSSRYVSWQVRAPWSTFGQPRTVSVNVTSNSYGESFTGYGADSVRVNPLFIQANYTLSSAAIASLPRRF